MDEAPLFLNLEDSLDWSRLESADEPIDVSSLGRQAGRFVVIDGGACPSVEQPRR